MCIRDSRQPLQPAVAGAHGGILAEKHVALDLALEHGHCRRVRVVAARQPRQVVVAPVVLGRGRRAPVGLHQGGEVRRREMFSYELCIHSGILF